MRMHAAVLFACARHRPCASNCVSCAQSAFDALLGFKFFSCLVFCFWSFLVCLFVCPLSFHTVTVILHILSVSFLGVDSYLCLYLLLSLFLCPCLCLCLCLCQWFVSTSKCHPTSCLSIFFPFSILHPVCNKSYSFRSISGCRCMVSVSIPVPVPVSGACAYVCVYSPCRGVP